LEEENQAMLDGYAQTMTQIKLLAFFIAYIRNAEKAVLEISALQNELIAQLASQEIITEQLYQDAVDSTESVEKGNKQLVKARRKNKSTTRFVLAFLVTMTLLLLFLDRWY
jgi:syntaxin 18